MELQKKIGEEKPRRRIFNLAGGSQGTEKPVLEEGRTKSRDPRGPGMQGTAIRGTSVTPPFFSESRSDLMWTPPAAERPWSEFERRLGQELNEQFGEAVAALEPTADMAAFRVAEESLYSVLDYLKSRATVRFRRLEDLTAIDESARREAKPGHRFTMVYNLLAFDPAVRLRLKVPMSGAAPRAASITGIVAVSGLVRTRSLRHVRDRFHGAPRPETHPDAGSLAGPSAAKILPRPGHGA